MNFLSAAFPTCPRAPGQKRPYTRFAFADSDTLNLGVSDDGTPPLQVARHNLPELARTTGRWLTAERTDAMRHRRIGQMRSDFSIESRDNFLWQLGRSNDADP